MDLTLNELLRLIALIFICQLPAWTPFARVFFSETRMIGSRRNSIIRQRIARVCRNAFSLSALRRGSASLVVIVLDEDSIDFHLIASIPSNNFGFHGQGTYC
jgi:hypothetical protein